jgi:hypothetical protein
MDRVCSLKQLCVGEENIRLHHVLFH